MPLDVCGTSSHSLMLTGYSPCYFLPQDWHHLKDSFVCTYGDKMLSLESISTCAATEMQTQCVGIKYNGTQWLFLRLCRVCIFHGGGVVD